VEATVEAPAAQTRKDYTSRPGAFPATTPRQESGMVSPELPNSPVKSWVWCPRNYWELPNSPVKSWVWCPRNYWARNSCRNAPAAPPPSPDGGAVV